jgi:hypothetical protein
MSTALPQHVHAKLDTFLACMLHRAADTDLDGVLASLAPAVGDLFEHTPLLVHDALTQALVHVAERYELGDEVAHIALDCQHQAAQAYSELEADDEE